MPVEYELARLKVVADGAKWTVKCHAAAWIPQDYPTKDILAVLSVTGAETAIVSIAAMLRDTRIKVNEIVFRDDDFKKELERDANAGYKTRISRLARGAFHLTAVTRRDGLLLSDDAATLYGELASERYTTPLMAAWQSTLREKLMELSYLQVLDGYAMSPALLTITTDQLDEVVSSAVREGLFTLSV